MEWANAQHLCFACIYGKYKQLRRTKWDISFYLRCTTIGNGGVDTNQHCCCQHYNGRRWGQNLLNGIGRHLMILEWFIFVVDMKRGKFHILDLTGAEKYFLSIDVLGLKLSCCTFVFCFLLHNILPFL